MIISCHVGLNVQRRFVEKVHDQRRFLEKVHDQRGFLEKIHDQRRFVERCSCLSRNAAPVFVNLASLI